MFWTFSVLAIAAGICFFVSPLARAATIVLLDGQKIEGQVIERTPLRVTVDVDGIPQTFFLGEIVSIDGKSVDILKPKQPSVKVPAKIKTPVPPLKPAPTNPPAPIPAPKINGMVVGMPQADGSFIVIGPDKIIKYDKDLNVVKALDLKADNSTGLNKPSQ